MTWIWMSNEIQHPPCSRSLCLEFRCSNCCHKQRVARRWTSLSVVLRLPAVQSAGRSSADLPTDSPTWNPSPVQIQKPHTWNEESTSHTETKNLIQGLRSVFSCLMLVQVRVVVSYPLLHKLKLGKSESMEPSLFETSWLFSFFDVDKTPTTGKFLSSHASQWTHAQFDK